MYRWFTTFLIAFALNTVWENVHSVLYTVYRGSAITPELLVFMAFKDALIICVLIAIATSTQKLRSYAWLIIPLGGLLFSIGVEWHALTTARWGYTPAMPIIPLLETGLTPTIQLASLGLVSYLAYRKI